MPNHKPATPLPFEQQRGFDLRSIISADGTMVAKSSQLGIGTTRGADNAAYLVHAANAYPRLVEALRNLAERCDGAEGVRDDGSNIDTSDAAGLLMELGERE